VATRYRNRQFVPYSRDAFDRLRAVVGGLDLRFFRNAARQRKFKGATPTIADINAAGTFIFILPARR
jgi:hypothetical protein